MLQKIIKGNEINLDILNDFEDDDDLYDWLRKKKEEVGRRRTKEDEDRRMWAQTEEDRI